MGMHVARWLVLVQLPRDIGCLAKGGVRFVGRWCTPWKILFTPLADCCLSMAPLVSVEVRTSSNKTFENFGTLMVFH